jgi:hypothetical protein
VSSAIPSPFGFLFFFFSFRLFSKINTIFDIINDPITKPGSMTIGRRIVKSLLHRYWRRFCWDCADESPEG